MVKNVPNLLTFTFEKNSLQNKGYNFCAWKLICLVSPSYLSLSRAVSFAFVPLSQDCFSTAEAELWVFPWALEGVRTHVGRQAWAGHKALPAKASRGPGQPWFQHFPRGELLLFLAARGIQSSETHHAFVKLPAAEAMQASSRSCCSASSQQRALDAAGSSQGSSPPPNARSISELPSRSPP